MISWPIRIQTNIQSFEYVLLMYVLPKRKGLRISKCVLKYLQFTTRHVYKCCCQNPFRTPQKMHTLPPLLWPLYSNISTIYSRVQVLNWIIISITGIRKTSRGNELFASYWLSHSFSLWFPLDFYASIDSLRFFVFMNDFVGFRIMLVFSEWLWWCWVS